MEGENSAGDEWRMSRGTRWRHTGRGRQALAEDSWSIGEHP